MARLNAKYGQLPRIESSEPDYNTIDKWASVPWTPPPSDDSDAASSESDTSDGEDGVRAQDEIVVLLDMATKVREQSDLIDILQAPASHVRRSVPPPLRRRSSLQLRGAR